MALFATHDDVKKKRAIEAFLETCKIALKVGMLNSNIFFLIMLLK